MAKSNTSEKTTITTNSLTIVGNLLKWSGTVIQISNISLVSTARVAKKAFPFLSLLLAVLGISLISIGIKGSRYGIDEGLAALGTVFLLTAGIWILIWASDRKNENEKENLNILLNAGLVYTILFNDRKFLAEVMRCFEQILSDQTHDKKVVINIKDNIITEGASVIEQMNAQ